MSLGPFPQIPVNLAPVLVVSKSHVGPPFQWRTSPCPEAMMLFASVPQIAVRGVFEPSWVHVSTGGGGTGVPASIRPPVPVLPPDAVVPPVPPEFGVPPTPATAPVDELPPDPACAPPLDGV